MMKRIEEGVLRRGGGGKGEVWIWGQDGDFCKLERKAEQATERSGVGWGAWSGGFQKSWEILRTYAAMRALVSTGCGGALARFS
jgi:hypothetical protein